MTVSMQYARERLRSVTINPKLDITLPTLHRNNNNLYSHRLMLLVCLQELTRLRSMIGVNATPELVGTLPFRLASS